MNIPTNLFSMVKDVGETIRDTPVSEALPKKEFVDALAEQATQHRELAVGFGGTFVEWLKDEALEIPGAQAIVESTNSALESLTAQAQELYVGFESRLQEINARGVLPEAIAKRLEAIGVEINARVETPLPSMAIDTVLDFLNENPDIEASNYVEAVMEKLTASNALAGADVDTALEFAKAAYRRNFVIQEFTQGKSSEEVVKGLFDVEVKDSVSMKVNSSDVELVVSRADFDVLHAKAFPGSERADPSVSEGFCSTSGNVPEMGSSIIVVPDDVENIAKSIAHERIHSRFSLIAEEQREVLSTNIKELTEVYEDLIAGVSSAQLAEYTNDFCEAVTHSMLEMHAKNEILAMLGSGEPVDKIRAALSPYEENLYGFTESFVPVLMEITTSSGLSQEDASFLMRKIFRGSYNAAVVQGTAYLEDKLKRTSDPRALAQELSSIPLTEWK